MVKKFVSSLTAVCLLSGVFTVSADEMQINYDSSVDASPTSVQTCSVDVEKAETYVVTLPKSIQLDGSQDSPAQSYDVTISGEISKNKWIRVIPRGGYVEDEGLTGRVDLTVEQEEIKWSYDAVANGAETTGTITADALDPGKYTGQVEFFVSLDDGYFYTAADCTTPKMKIAFDTNDNGIQDSDETLETPIAVGVPLGHTYDGVHTFEYTCTRCLKTIYEVSTPEELYDFAEAVNGGNNFSGKTVSLIADLDMQESTTANAFIPIGSKSSFFRGTFEGNNHSISKITAMKSISVPVYAGAYNLTDYASGTTGLFGAAGYDAEIKNLILQDSNILVQGCGSYIATVGAIVGQTDEGVTISNCRVTNWSTTWVGTEYTIKGFASPYVGAVAHTNTESDRVVIRDSCATGFNTTFDLSAQTGSEKAVYLSRAVGYGSHAPSVTLENMYTVGSVSYISTNAGTTGTKTCGYAYAPSTGTASYITTRNLPFTYSLSNMTSSENCSIYTAEHLLSADLLTLLNTGHDTPVWKLDLLNENNGYPIQIV